MIGFKRTMAQTRATKELGVYFARRDARNALHPEARGDT